jgi:drug/metabolite transporter (DMT)-like permease
VDRARDKIDALPFAAGQYLVCGLLSLGAGALFERPTAAEMLYVLPAVLYTAVFSIAIGFTLQVLGQKHTPANDAAIILSTEAVFAVFFGWLFLHETLLTVQVVGCALIMLAVPLVQFRNGKIKP